MRGVQFVIDEDGVQQAVLIDLKRNRRLWEDFYDTALAMERKYESRESFDEVQRSVLAKKRRDAHN